MKPKKEINREEFFNSYKEKRLKPILIVAFVIAAGFFLKELFTNGRVLLVILGVFFAITFGFYLLKLIGSSVYVKLPVKAKEVLRQIITVALIILLLQSVYSLFYQLKTDFVSTISGAFVFLVMLYFEKKMK